ncbi:MAG: putative metalloprotease CJM1_0395 family protein [Trichlorobacter sp.]|jgi:hypothetical protein
MDPLASISTRQGYGGVEQSVAPAGTPGQPAVHTPAAAGTDSRRERQGIQLPDDRVSLSGQRPAAAQQQPAATGQDPAAEQTTRDGTSLEDPQIQQMVARLKQTEQKVKAHEAAHKAAGGNLASGASYSYTQGPDGRNYITGGEVQIDMSPGRTPQETVSKMQQVIRAALAPADPSGQDRAVAAQAANQMTQARQAYAGPAVRANGTTTSGTTSAAPQQPSGTSQPDAAAALSAYA